MGDSSEVNVPEIELIIRLGKLKEKVVTYRHRDGIILKLELITYRATAFFK